MPTPLASDDRELVSADEYEVLIPDDEYLSTLMEDGGLSVEWGDPIEEQGPPVEFYSNLADVLPDPIMERIAQELAQKIDYDKQAREMHDEKVAEGTRRTGLGDEAPGGAQFTGASRVVHPGLIEACIDGEARLMKELWPVAGPVRQKIRGKMTKEKSERAERQVAYMNHQLTDVIEEARPVMETTLTQVMLGGSHFIKLWWDARLARARMQFVPVDKVYLPATAESFLSSIRWTFDDAITNIEYRQRVDQGMYRDIGTLPTGMVPDPTKSQKAADKIQGVKPEGINIDSERQIHEIMSYVEVSADMADVLGGPEEEGALCPYLVTIDAATKKVLSFYRNWEEDDPTYTPIQHLFEFGFIPWRGALTIGFTQIIGGLSGAATGALRALLDSAHAANAQGGYILKGSGMGGQTPQPVVGELVEIDSNMAANDIRQLIMPYSQAQPSPVLYQLLGFLVDGAKGVVRTSLDDTAIDTNANTPVGTQLSRVEEGLVVFSSVHGRLHTAFDRFLGGLARINRMYLPKRVTIDVDNKEVIVERKDFETPAIQPTSNPTIYSDQQRWNQMLVIEESAMKFPQLYDLRKIQERKLKLIKVQDPDELLVAKPKPTELNAVNENVAMSLGRPVVAFHDQDHLAHLQVHLDFAKNPVLGGNPIIGPKFMPSFLQHCVEHILYFYVEATDTLVAKAAGTGSASDLMTNHPDVKREFDRLLAMASQLVGPFTMQTFSGAMEVLGNGLKMVQAITPPPQVDPGAAAAKAAADETQRRAQDDSRKGELAAAELNRKTAKDAADIAVKREKIASDEQVKKEANDLSMTETVLETSTAKDIAAERIEHGQKPGVSTGEGLSTKDK